MSLISKNLLSSDQLAPRALWFRVHVGLIGCDAAPSGACPHNCVEAVTSIGERDQAALIGLHNDLVVDP